MSRMRPSKRDWRCTRAPRCKTALVGALSVIRASAAERCVMSHHHSNLPPRRLPKRLGGGELTEDNLTTAHLSAVKLQKITAERRSTSNIHHHYHGSSNTTNTTNTARLWHIRQPFLPFPGKLFRPATGHYARDARRIPALLVGLSQAVRVALASAAWARLAAASLLALWRLWPRRVWLQKRTTASCAEL